MPWAMPPHMGEVGVMLGTRASLVNIVHCTPPLRCSQSMRIAQLLYMLLANLVTCVQYPLLPICVVSHTCLCGQPTSHHSLPHNFAPLGTQVEQSWSNWCCRLLGCSSQQCSAVDPIGQA